MMGTTREEEVLMQTIQEEEVFEKAKEDMVDEEHAEISFCVDVGITSSSSVLKIVGYVKKLPITIMVDNGSINSLPSPQVIKTLRSQTMPLKLPIKVRVANKQELYYDMYIPNLHR